MGHVRRRPCPLRLRHLHLFNIRLSQSGQIFRKRGFKIQDVHHFIVVIYEALQAIYFLSLSSIFGRWLTYYVIGGRHSSSKINIIFPGVSPAQFSLSVQNSGLKQCHLFSKLQITEPQFAYECIQLRLLTSTKGMKLYSN